MYREGTGLDAIKAQNFNHDIPKDNRSLPPTKIFAEHSGLDRMSVKRLKQRFPLLMQSNLNTKYDAQELVVHGQTNRGSRAHTANKSKIILQQQW